MKKLLLSGAFLLAVCTVKAQETLQTVTERGYTTTKNVENAIVVQEGTSGNHLQLYQQAGTSYLVAGNANGAPTQRLAIYAGGGERMSILPNGNVGIGTINPASKLEVMGQITNYNVGLGQITMNASTKNYTNFSSNNHGSVIVSSNLFFDGNDELKIANSHPTMSGVAILMPGNSQPNQGGIIFYTNEPTSVSEGQTFSGSASMSILKTGNVGIGTTTPNEKLAVNGKIRAKEIKVETANWPDYVFEEDYKVGTLEELERYIKANKRLPEMPSAKEVEANGVELGELNKLLLKKQEELTLHLIEQNKQVQKLMELVTSQQKEIEKLKAVNKK